MEHQFPSAVPELPVSNLNEAIAYYVSRLGFRLDWGSEDGGGIAGISNGRCRLFLSGNRFRERYKNTGPVVIWINLESKKEVDELYELWSADGAAMLSAPESKPWKLHEFTAADLDGNVLRVFYDCSNDA